MAKPDEQGETEVSSFKISYRGTPTNEADEGTKASSSHELTRMLLVGVGRIVGTDDQVHATRLPRGN